MKLRIERSHSLMLMFAMTGLLAPKAAIGQVLGGGSQLTCTVNSPVKPTLRGEGYTEQAGDIVITCTGGVAPEVGAVVPWVNIAVYLNTSVTSRLLPATNVSELLSEALLLIDEPNSGLQPQVPGFGPGAGLSVCTTPLSGCVEYVSRAAGSSVNVATDTPQGNAANAPGKNVFPGIVANNSVVFYGVPVLAPGNATRVLRITNIRVNAAAVAFGAADDSLTPVQASVSISGVTSLPLQGSSPLVGYVSGRVATSLENPVACGTCTGVTVNPAATLSFRENFQSAFKTRVLAQDNIAYAGQNGTPGSNGFGAQNVAGSSYNSESGLVVSVGAGQTAGLTDAGTRLKAVFNNIPAGVRILVSVANIDANGLPVAAPAVPGGLAANTGTTGYAQLTSSETGAFAPVAAQENGPGGIPMQEIAVVNGSATAIWEVINTNPNALENLRFEVCTYSPSGASVTPITANLSYAPAPLGVPASQASADLPVPRFVADSSVTRPLSSAALPNLGIAKTHAGAFVQGQLGAVYQLTVTNHATVSTDGSPVTVTDTLPSGMAVTAISGAGWTCSTGTVSCTRSDALAGGASYPAITLSVNVAGNASSPVVNHASVSGGGSPSASVDDVTTVIPQSVDAGSVGPNWIELSCPEQATAGSTVFCAVNLRANSGAVDSYAFSAAITPRATAPALATGQVGFAQSRPGAVKAVDGTHNAISVAWTNVEVMSWAQLGSIAFVMPATAGAGQAYAIAITSVNASYRGNTVPISAGLSAIVAIPSPGQPGCTANALPLQLRGEGYSEQTSDIILSCSGGTAPEVGTAIPQANFTIAYNLPITSRLLPQAGALKASEALLIIDEPGSGLPSVVRGFGPEAPRSLCATAATGCMEYVSTKAGSTVPVSTDTPQGTAASTPGKNVFQGVIEGNSVTFYGVPIMSTGSTGMRVFRITNVRVNSSAMRLVDSGPGLAVASISMSGGTAWNLTNTVPNVGFVNPGLGTVATAVGTLSQCSSQALAPAGQISFDEKFGTSFKTRLQAVTNTPYAGQSGTPAQSVPGTDYNSESNFVVPVAGGESAGLANFGTRLKAQFQVPAGVRLFVSAANVQTNGLPVVPPAIIGGSAANSLGPSYAQLTASETGAFSVVPSNTSAGSVPVVELPVTSGVATAVWEVVNKNAHTTEALRFGVFTSYASNPAQYLPAPGAVTANLSFAPTPPTFSGGTAGSASSTLPIPRFAADANTAANLFTIGSCASATAPTATSLTVSDGRGTNRFNLTATVTTSASGAGNPAGTVTFYDNGTCNRGKSDDVKCVGRRDVRGHTQHGEPQDHCDLYAFGRAIHRKHVSGTSAFVGEEQRQYRYFQQPLSFVRRTGRDLYGGSDGRGSHGNRAVYGRLATARNRRAWGRTRERNSDVAHCRAARDICDVLGRCAHGDASARFGHRVDRVTQVVTLASSKATVDFGQPLILAATLTIPAPAGVAAATGSVQFQEGTVVLGSAPVAGGVSALTVAKLLPGRHEILAVYSGDASWYGGHSEAVTVNVSNAVVAVTLASSAAITGLKLSATLTPAMGAGTVEFVDTTEKATVGSARPASGTVELAIAAEDAVKLAGHVIVATYSGSGGFAGATSNALALPALRNSAGGASQWFAPDELVSLFGSQLGGAPQAAEASALPKTLDGLRVNVADASGAVFASDLRYVSAAQVNFVMPPALANGPGLVSVLRNGVVIAAMPVRLGRVAPGLFAGSQIAPTEAGDVYLALYATGIRNASGKPALTCSVNGRSLAVAFAGPHRDFAGLDQVNVLLPADLRGNLDISLMVDGQQSNGVTVSVQ